MYQNTKISKNINDLKYENSILFEIGNALDGFPMLLSLRESNSNFGYMNALNALQNNIGTFSSTTNRKVDELILEMTYEFRLRNFVKIVKNGIEEEYYLEDNYFVNRQYYTAAQKLFGDYSPLNFEQKYDFNKNKTIANTSAAFSNNLNEFEVREKLKTKKTLAINTTTQKISVLNIPNDDHLVGAIPSRPYINESLDELFPSYYIKDKKNDAFLGVLKSIEYPAFVHNYSNKSSKFLDRILVKRQLVLEKLAKSIGFIDELHLSGKIHGDIKPSNILFDGKLFHFIDSLDVPIGQVAVGFTKNYCAPEQVTALSVSPATDIYHLGLLILQLLEGALVGPLNEIVIPTGKNNTTTVKLITKPSVYLDRLHSIFSNQNDIKVWQDFLEKALAFEPSGRFQNINAFIDDLNFLLYKHPLTSSVEINPNFGRIRLPSNVDNKTYWVL